METLSSHRCFGGTLGYYRHQAASTHCPMRFTVFAPPQADQGQPLPAVIFLSGLTCTEDNFTVKAGAYRLAAELGLVIIAPDTSPRGEGVATGPDYSLGLGAGFYIDATQQPWASHYRMEQYIAHELHDLIPQHFPVDAGRIGLCGHSMGGHGALTLAMKYPRQYHSLSAFAPICAPTQSVWARAAFTAYLGTDEATWAAHDATQRMLAGSSLDVGTILIDQGSDDPFLERLHPHLFAQACAQAGQALTLRMQPGYDHGYFFIQSFIDDHLRHHAARLAG